MVNPAELTTPVTGGILLNGDTTTIVDLGHRPAKSIRAHDLDF
jgi:hypothetical protein